MMSYLNLINIKLDTNPEEGDEFADCVGHNRIRRTKQSVQSTEYTLLGPAVPAVTYKDKFVQNRETGYNVHTLVFNKNFANNQNRIQTILHLPQQYKWQSSLFFQTY